MMWIVLQIMIYVNVLLEWIRSFFTWVICLFKHRAEYNINGFRVQEVSTIGEGGYGFIYRVQDITNPRSHYALKKMICQTPQSKLNFENQVKMLELAGKHENIVEVYGVHRIQRNQYIEGLILMELGDKTLFNYLVETEHKRISQKEILSLLIPICKGLKHLHDKRIAHRDLKVQNILLMQNVPKLCDFGSASIERVDLSKVSKSQLYTYEQTFEKYSTLMYRPPEMIDLYLKYEVNEKVDIWMLGCVVYVMNFYVHPFQQSGKLAIVNAQYRFPQDKRVSQKMKDFIRILLTPNPKLRPSIEVVLNIIESWEKLTSIPLNRVVRGMKDNEKHLKEGNYQQLKFQYNDAIAAADEFSDYQ